MISQVKLNKAKKQLYTRKTRTLENIPPTQAALEQHFKGARYQTHCWKEAKDSNPQLPDPSNYGWRKDGGQWQPVWTTLPEESRSCYELIHCGYKKGCSGRCKCIKAALTCTALCFCSGDCQN